MMPTLLPLFLAAGLLALLTGFFLLWPLRGRAADAGLPARQLATRVYRERLQELNADHMAGRLDAEAYAQLKLDLDRSLLADSEGLAEAVTAASPTPRSLRPFALVVLLGLPLLSLGLYVGLFLDRGVAPDLANQATMAPTLDRLLGGQEPTAEDSRHTLQQFVRALQRRVEREPNNAEAWLTLGMGFMQARDYDPAKVALARAAELRPEDMQVVMTWLQAEVMTQQGTMSPRVRGTLGRILHDHPDHQGALLMLAMASLRGNERAAAVEALTHLQRLRAAQSGASARDSEADAEISRLLAQATQAPGAAVTGARYELEVSVAPELARQIPADATLFVFARAMQGAPMPVAVIRRPASGFPLLLTLSDADSLNPSRPLSGEAVVVVQAKVSRTGSATQTTGDWVATAVPVARGSQGVIRLRISETR